VNAASAGAKDAETSERRRVLGPFDATMVVAGGVVGVGIFALPGRVAQRLPDERWIVAAWAVGGVIALFGALTFARLGRRVPRAGGTYAFLRAAFGPLPAFLFGWASLLTINSGAMAFMAAMVSTNIVLLCGGETGDAGTPLGTAIAIAAIVVLTVVNALGVRQGGWTQDVVTVFKLLALGGLSLLGWLVAAQAGAGGGDGGARRTGAGSEGSITIAAFCFALLPVLFSYGGWQNACNLAEEVRRPERTLPFAIVVGTASAVVLYVLFIAAVLRQLGVEGTAGAEPIAAVALGVAVLGDLGSRVVSAAIGLSALGVLNGFILGTPWILYAMARDGCFLRVFARLDPRSGTPLFVLVLQAALAVLYVLAADVEEVIDGLVVIDWLFFALAGAACVRLCAGEGPRAWLVPGFFACLALGIIGVVVWESVAGESTRAPMALVQLGVLGVGVVVYGVWLRGRG
jgi:APA family basic amino acid/polyamine antiporter